MLNLAVFVSGRGSNLRAIHATILAGTLDARVVLVLASRDDAPALSWAQTEGIPAVSLQDVPIHTSGETILRFLLERGTDFVALAGYLRRIPAEVVQRFTGRMLNIHPALLPSFGGPGMYGHHVHSAVIDAGVKVSGATVHLVDEEYDRGPIVLQRCIPVRGDDTPETLAARILPLEHQLLPEALQLFASGKVQIVGKRVIIND
jgi:phosphoribosylglycinamide formyltransferase-1